MSTKPKIVCSPFRMLEASGVSIRTDASDPDFANGLEEAEHGLRPDGGLRRNAAEPGLIRIGLVDSFAFTRGCLVDALTTPARGFAVMAFETTAELIQSGVRDIDVVMYYDHDPTPSCALGTANHLQAHDDLAEVPTIVLSDATTALDPQTVRAALKCGVRGFISTRVVEMKTVSAAVRFVTAGGVFAPVDLLLADDVKPPPVRGDMTSPAGLLTPRQMTVLSLLEEGKANKIIAYELGMSESTVKVHIRNIMRKMGATNRTQAIYKLRQLSYDRAPDGSAGQ